MPRRRLLGGGRYPSGLKRADAKEVGPFTIRAFYGIRGGLNRRVSVTYQEKTITISASEWDELKRHSGRSALRAAQRLHSVEEPEPEL